MLSRVKVIWYEKSRCERKMGEGTGGEQKIRTEILTTNVIASSSPDR